ncbi:MAG: hypothetical protein ACLUSL_10055 [Ruminococcus sp.]
MIARYDLSGVWELSLAQMAGKQVPAAFDDTISLPGTTSLAKKGTPNPARETGFLTDAYAFEGAGMVSENRLPRSRFSQASHEADAGAHPHYHAVDQRQACGQLRQPVHAPRL